MADESENMPVSAENEVDQENCGASARQREERIKATRERQSEERQRKLDELKQHAEATQKFREQQEEERRRRIEEQKQRDAQRRSMVEERKKALLDAERDRKEAMMRRYQDRESRLETKRRNERGSMAFAFGSSTPRILEPVDSSAYWSSRRSTSTVNVMSSWMQSSSPLGELHSNESEQLSSAKRAASVFLLDQPAEGHGQRMTNSMYEIFHWDSSGGKGSTRHESESFHGEQLMTQSALAVLDGRRRRTDLIPTIPVHRDSQPRPGSSRSTSARSSISHRGADSSASSGLVKNSMSCSTGNLSSSAAANHEHQEEEVMSTPTNQQPRMTRAERLRQRAKLAGLKKKESDLDKSGLNTPTSPVRPLSAMSHQSSGSSTAAAAASSHHVRARTAPAAARKPRPISIAGSVPAAQELKHKTPSKESSEPFKEKRTARPAVSPAAPMKPSRTPKLTDKPPKTAKPPTVEITKAEEEPANQEPLKEEPSNKEPDDTEAANKHPAEEESTQAVEGEEDLATEAKAEENPVSETPAEAEPANQDELDKETLNEAEEQPAEELANKDPAEGKSSNADAAATEAANKDEVKEETANEVKGDEKPEKPKKIITSEEEAKAALAEKRRLAREQMEREAEAERLRIEAEQRAEEERRQQEEVERKLAEEEMERLAREAKQAEEDRLKKAIEEAQRREEEERLRQEEEARQRVEKEQAEQKAREEAERLRRENEERLRREEEERQERRKRVEAIMSRTRGKNKAASAASDAENARNSLNDSSAAQQQPDLLENIVGKTESSSENGYLVNSTNPAALPDVSLMSNADNVNSNIEKRVD